MNLTNFSQSPTGRVIKVGDGKLAYSAFVPNPLPPPFTCNAELIRLMSQADRALGELAGLGRGLNNAHLLIGPFIRREAVLSSRIGRLLISLLLVYWGLLPLPLLYS